MGLYLLSKISELNRINVGIYRTNGLLITPVPPRQGEKIKQKIGKIFSEEGLSITHEIKISNLEMTT